MNRHILGDILKQLGQRIVRPGGLTLAVGDVVEKDGQANLHLIGSIGDVIEMTPNATPGIRVFDGAVHQYYCSTHKGSEGVSVKAVAPVLPHGVSDGRIKLNVAFDHADAWIVAATGCSTSVMENEHLYRRPILESLRKKNGLWSPRYGMVTGVTSVTSASIVTSQTRETNVGFDAEAMVGIPNVGVQLAVKPSLTSASKGIGIEDYGPSTFLATVVGVTSKWLPRRRRIATYRGAGQSRQGDDFVALSLAAEDFWEEFPL